MWFSVQILSKRNGGNQGQLLGFHTANEAKKMRLSTQFLNEKNIGNRAQYFEKSDYSNKIMF